MNHYLSQKLNYDDRNNFHSEMFLKFAEAIRCPFGCLFGVQILDPHR